MDRPRRRTVPAVNIDAAQTGRRCDVLVESIRMLADRFPRETVVYSGHGPKTTLGTELARNPFLAELRA